MTTILIVKKMDKILVRMTDVENRLTAIQTTGKVLVWATIILMGTVIGAICILWVFIAP